MASPFQPVPQTDSKNRSQVESTGRDDDGIYPPKLFDTALRKKRILHVEFDPTLLALRHALLETAGFEVISCFNDMALREVSTSTAPIHLFVIGHAAPLARRNDLVTWIKANFPETTVVVLRARETDASPVGDVHTTSEPEDLVTTILELVKRG